MKDSTKKLHSVLGIAVRAAVILALIAMGPLGSFSPGVSANDDDDKPKDKDHRDHSLFFTGSTPADEAIFCGVKKGRGYTLHISGSANGSAGSFIINFRDGDAMGFNVPDGFTLSTTHDLGGVPTVDDLVKITVTGGVNSMMVSVNADKGAQDPFDETLDSALAEKDNFCTREAGTGVPGPTGGEAGHTSAKALFVPPILPLT